jgi:hypothetical protein
VSGAVESIERILQRAAEQRLDLDRLARLKEREEPPERLHVRAPRGLANATLHQRGNHPVDAMLGNRCTHSETVGAGSGMPVRPRMQGAR